jgi:hypothetical protein
MRKSIVFPLFTIMLSCLLMGTAISQDHPQKLTFSLGGGIDFGGDKIAEVYFTNGADQSVNAGQGGSILAALDYAISKSFRIRTVAGYKYVTTAANNANIRLTRFPIQVSGIVNLDKNWWLTAGLATQQGIRFKGDGFLDDLRLKTKGGATFGLGYNLVYLSYTGMKYKDNLQNEYNASSIGLGFLLPLKKRTRTVLAPVQN